MGCSNVKQNVTIDISYCGGCGWSLPAKRICQKILEEIPQATIDCRPQEGYTGTLIASLIIQNGQDKEIYRGDKETTVANIFCKPTKTVDLQKQRRTTKNVIAQTIDQII